MKKFKSTSSKLVFAAAFAICALTPQPVQAQISFDDDVDDEVPAAPIDGLLGLGLVAGVMYGVKYLKEKK